MSKTLGIVLVVGVFVGFAAFLVWRHHRMRTANDDLLEHGGPTTALVRRIAPVLGEDDLFTLRLHLDDREVEVQATSSRAARSS